MIFRKSMLLLLCLGSFGLLTSSFQTPPAPSAPAKINWVSLEEAVAAAAEDGKMILVDLTTEWCGWCKRMDRDTYSKEKVAAYVNEHFHAVKFDAEKTTRSITLKNQTFKHRPEVGRNGLHEFAAYVTNGRPSYPTASILDHKLNLVTNVPGYHKADEMLMILSFLAEGAYESTSWENYQREYKQR